MFEKQFYIMLKDGQSWHNGNFEFSLPKDGNPGEWQEVDEENVTLWKSGFHITCKPSKWNYPGVNQIFPVEIDYSRGVSEQKETDRGIIAVKRMRLLPPVKVIQIGNDTITTKDGYLHSYDDQPAITSPYGTYWYKNGKIHRENNLPAIINTNGTKQWLIEGEHYCNENGLNIEFSEIEKRKFRYNEMIRMNYQGLSKTRFVDFSPRLETISIEMNKAHNDNSNSLIPNREKQYYKVLKNGKSFNGGEHTWDLPKDDQPGEWQIYEGDIFLFYTGFHVTDCPVDRVKKENGIQIFPVEIDWTEDTSEYFNETVSVRKLRLLPAIKEIKANNCNATATKDGYLHSYDDEPSVVSPRGKFWHKDGCLHRENNKPAFTEWIGTEEFYMNGKEIANPNEQEINKKTIS